MCRLYGRKEVPQTSAKKLGCCDHLEEGNFKGESSLAHKPMNVNMRNLDAPPVKNEYDEEKSLGKATEFKTKLKPQRPMHFLHNSLVWVYKEKNLEKATAFKTKMKATLGKATAFKTKMKPQRSLHSTWEFSFIIVLFEYNEEKILEKTTAFKTKMKSTYCVKSSL